MQIVCNTNYLETQVRTAFGQIVQQLGGSSSEQGLGSGFGEISQGPGTWEACVLPFPTPNSHGALRIYPSLIRQRTVTTIVWLGGTASPGFQAFVPTAVLNSKMDEQAMV